jgi:hypothetical protein
VLLQCLSPLAHAHVDGYDAGHSLHSHEWTVHTQMTESHVENDEGAVVAMPHAYPAVDSPVVSEPPLASPNNSLRIHTGNTILAIAVGRADFVIQNACYVLAWSQAPPRITLTA